MAESLLYFTELLGMAVHDLKGRRIGRVKDAAVVPVVHPSRVDRYLVGGGWSWLSVRYDQIASFSLDSGIQLSDEQLIPYHDDEYMLRLNRDLLDQQIIDVNGRKVVRVTDVTFEIHSGGPADYLAVLEVDIGMRSIFRRLCQGVAPPRWVRRLQQRIPPSSIRWDFCNIIEPDPQRRLRLNISNQMLEKMHPAALADIVEELSPAERGAIFETIDSEVAADALTEVDPKMQASILESLEPEKAADIVEEMAPETEVRELLEYEDDTAGGLMNTEYVALPENATVADALAALHGNEDLLDSLNTLFLLDADGRLVAGVPLARLFVASPGAPLRVLATDRAIQVGLDEKQDRLTELFDKYNLLTLPVVDE